MRSTGPWQEMHSHNLNKLRVPDEAGLRSADARFATTLARGLSVLEAFRPGEASLGNAELARRTGLSRQTVVRLTATLVDLALLQRDASGYRLGARLLTLAHPLLRRLSIRQAARPILKELADYARGAVSLAMLDGLDVVFVETSLGTDPHPLSPDIGTTAPLLQTAAGRAVLALLPPADRMAVFEAFRTQRPALFAAFAEAATREIARAEAAGFTLSLGDYRPEVRAVAVPLGQAGLGERLALNCSIPLYRLKPGALEAEIAPRAVAAASAIRALMPAAP